MSQKRANKGGEIGLNDEFYPGGTFLPTTTLGKLPKGKKGGKVRKVQVEPYKWEEAREGFRPIYSFFCGVERILSTGDFGSIAPQTVAYYGMDIEEMKRVRELYIAGERWVAVS